MKPTTVASSTLTVCLALSLASVAWSQEATNLGPEDRDKQISVTVWLNLHNKGTLDALVRDMYDGTSANYHRFLTMAQYKAEFAPTAADAAVVRNFLAAHNLKVTSIDQNNHFLVAQGRVGDAQEAFNVKINRVMVNGGVHRMSASEASLAGPAGPLGATVQGLSDLGYRSHASAARNPET